jgi:hypothetical protein
VALERKALDVFRMTRQLENGWSLCFVGKEHVQLVQVVVLGVNRLIMGHCRHPQELSHMTFEVRAHEACRVPVQLAAGKELSTPPTIATGP